MVKELIYVSVFAILLTSLFANLYSIAKETSEKTVVFADDMKNAIDCATRGISIYYCSPDLDSEQFLDELNKTRAVLNETSRKLKSGSLNQYDSQLGSRYTMESPGNSKSDNGHYLPN